jgi:hypothetical protein
MAHCPPERGQRPAATARAVRGAVPCANSQSPRWRTACDAHRVVPQSSRLAPLPDRVTRLAAAHPHRVLWGVRGAAGTSTGIEGAPS